MTAAAYDIATEHAILAEASAAGNLQALPAALLFGVLLGALYDLFRMISSALGVREDAGSDGGRLRKWILHLRQYRCRALPWRRLAVGGGENETGNQRHRIPARVVQAMLDILYFLICGVSGAVFLYWRNSGILRWYLILCGVLGFLAYSRSIGRFLLPVFLLCTALIRAGMCAWYNGILYYPLYVVYRILTVFGTWCRRIDRAVWQKIQTGRCRRRVRRILCAREPDKDSPKKKGRPRRRKAEE